MSSSNTSALRGACPAPFLDVSKFPTTGGNIDARLCAAVPQLQQGLTCCLPCPVMDWIYPSTFHRVWRAAEWLSVIGIVICVLLLASWTFLPPEKSRRNYLSICIVISILMVLLSFVVPLGARPPLCYNEITPNDMYSNLACAFSGAFITAGGLSISVWIFIRALSLHLQICWDIVPGRRFFYFSQAAGWGVVVTLFIITMAITGVSNRFGESCQANTKNSLGDFWGPLLAIASAAGVVQFMTFAYCLKLYIQNIWSDEETETNTSTGMPSYTSSVGGHSIRAVYRRMKKVLWLQWRSMTVVVFLLVDVLFFAIVFMHLDNEIKVAAKGNIDNFMPFLECLVFSGGDRTKCFASGQKAILRESTATAILMLLSLTGFQTGLLEARSSMFSSWWWLLVGRFKSDPEFVWVDPKRISADQRDFELSKMGSPMSPGDAEAAMATPAIHSYTLPEYLYGKGSTTTRE